ncbi:MAG: flavodoxin family protein [Eggerthellaceae bacterium]|nr:flavodoxin family protein [Eggerthellaceae bacterium]
MKVLLVNGSPRKNGNTDRALEECAAVLNAEGIETELIWIGAQPIRGCTACGACTRNGDNKCIFDDDLVNPLIRMAAEADGYIFGSPVYYAGLNGSLKSLMDRMFYAGGSVMRQKPAAGIACARRAGSTLTADEINKFFQINGMPVVSSTYWNVVHGRGAGEVVGDGEGLQTMRNLGRSMAWLLKCIEAGAAAGIAAPELERGCMTNMVREDLVDGQH